MRRKDAEEKEEERRVDEEGGQSRRSGRREVTEGREEAGRGQTDGREVQRTLPRPAYPHRACNCNCNSREPPRVRPGEIALDLVQHASKDTHSERTKKGEPGKDRRGEEETDCGRVEQGEVY